MRISEELFRIAKKLEAAEPITGNLITETHIGMTALIVGGSGKAVSGIIEDVIIRPRRRLVVINTHQGRKTVNANNVVVD